MERSSLPSVSRGLVYINIPGHTRLRELIIEYEQVTTWEARFSSNKLEANYHILSVVVCTGWFNGQGTSRRHYSLVNFKTSSWKEPLAELLTRLIRDHL